ncbi:hypothetical protein [Arsenicicoccus dermatophilus]|uniref:hypothetical protein n=1 Tax=Arsenicicoccus dermatophilus TaxID=1076331 RepID=UPI003916DE9D
MTDEPRILHLNDCAYVARQLVDAAARTGRRWDYLPPERVRPATVPANPLLAKATYARFVADRALHVGRADVVHVHYGTTARLLRERGIPRRPYVLTLHGTDIREQWQDPRFHDEIRRGIDEAAHVYYTNLDTVEQATTARADAEYLPAFVDLTRLPAWTPAPRPTVVFASRWDDVKGAAANLELARALGRALPEARLVGLDWGAHAARAGELVELLPRTDHAGYLRLLATAHVAVGQARDVLGVSEFEAMAIGVPTAILGARIPRPDDGTTPPVLEGTVDEVVAQVRDALADPAAASARLGARTWVAERHVADPVIPRLVATYQAAVRG